jgi:hypothetical protein
MGASSEPAVVIFLYLYLHPWYTFAAQACFGECFQWGYWTRMRNVEGCSAAREFESPTLRSLPQRASSALRNSCYTVFAFLMRVQKLGSQRAALRSRPYFLYVRPSDVIRSRCAWEGYPAHVQFQGGDFSSPFSFCTALAIASTIPEWAGVPVLPRLTSLHCKADPLLCFDFDSENHRGAIFLRNLGRTARLFRDRGWHRKSGRQLRHA